MYAPVGHDNAAPAYVSAVLPKIETQYDAVVLLIDMLDAPPGPCVSPG